MQVNFGDKDGLSGNLKFADSNFALIIAHGFQVTQKNELYQDIARLIHENGISTLTFDFKGCGESGGEHVERCFQSETEDIEVAVNFLNNELDNPGIHILGHSRGAVSSLIYASNHDNIESVIACCPPEDLEKGWTNEIVEVIEEQGYVEDEGIKIGRKMWEDIKKYSKTSNIARGIDTNSTIVIASNDQYVKQSNNLINKFDNRIKLNTGHYLENKRSELCEELSQMINEY